MLPYDRSIIALSCFKGDWMMADRLPEQAIRKGKSCFFFGKLELRPIIPCGNRAPGFVMRSSRMYFQPISVRIALKTWLAGPPE